MFRVVARRRDGQLVRTCLRVLVRAVGVYFQADGNFYTMGGRTSDAAGSDFQHVLQYDPSIQQLDSDGVDIARQPDEQHGLWRAHRLRHPQIYCVGGSAAGPTTATARVFTYNPATDTRPPSLAETTGLVMPQAQSCQVALRWLTTSYTSWAGSTST